LAARSRKRQRTELILSKKKSSDEIPHTCALLAPSLHQPIFNGGTVMQEMTTIPPSQWGSFLAQFSARHCGQEADIEHVDPESMRPVAIRLPLIRVESSGERGSEGEFHVLSGDQTGIIEDAIANPIRIKVKEWDAGQSAELEMASRNGGAIRVRVSGPSTMQ